MKRQKLTNKGFTLVELIVVLVILAILAAILVPALLGYIDEANNKRYVLAAKNVLNATQSEFSKLYAERTDFNSNYYNIMRNDRGKTTGAIADLSRSGVSKEIFQIAGYEINPDNGNNRSKYDEYFWNAINKDTQYNKENGVSKTKNNLNFVCVGVGNYQKYANPDNNLDIHKAYTVYMIIYQPYNKADFVVFDGKNFVDKWPFSTKLEDAFSSANKDKFVLNVNGEDIVLQFYIIKAGQDNNWNTDSNKIKELLRNCDNYFANR